LDVSRFFAPLRLPLRLCVKLYFPRKAAKEDAKPQRCKTDDRLLLRACNLDTSARMLQSSRTKVLIRLGKSLFLGSGKATTRVKRSITAAFEGTDFRIASPRGHPEETVLLP